jgi:hypothetical protein
MPQPYQAFNAKDLGHVNKLRTLYGEAEFVNAMMDGMTFWEDTTITSAEILTLNTTPIQIVAAPSASTIAVIPLAMFGTITYNSTTYSVAAGGLVMKYTDGAGTAPGLVFTQAFAQSGASSSQWVNASTTAFTPTAGAKLVLQAATSDPTTGNSALKVRVYYRLAPVPLPTY